MAQENELNIPEMSLPELQEMNEFYETQLEGLNKGARAKGGTGANKRDEQAREFSQKQVKLEGAIFDRLSGVHEDRSKKARIADESKRAEIADSPTQWKNDPDNYDWPGIDTPR